MVREEDIIICDNIPRDKYVVAVKKAVIYAVLSVPYTVDRMGFGNSPDGIKKRILNISKGKVAEYLFEQYCLNTGYDVSRDKTETPFWRYDKNDFIINGTTVDLKNNFVYGFKPDNACELPALVPQKQFEKVKKFDFCYVFSFLPKIHDNFFDIHFTKESLLYIGGLNNNCSGKELTHKPEYYTSDNEWFKNLFDTYGKEKEVVTFEGDFPQLVIAGCANRRTGDMDMFKLTGPDAFKTSGGDIYTKVDNYFTPIKNLSPFTFEKTNGTVLDERQAYDYNEILKLFD